ncbi:hypothetical protein ACFO9Q_18865 [Paenibacillus sp. GCM10023252]|uniref:hypothetical protein n=1 Tax=Paenibacillus sp. GCM10023252 TaxID=3252649 RepID=UPI003614C848
MSRQEDMHETQPSEQVVHGINDHYVDEQLRAMQNIEGGGPPRRVIWEQLPKPLRVFGYCFIGFMLLMTALLLLSSFLQ